jgi:hypothetical protein
MSTSSRALVLSVASLLAWGGCSSSSNEPSAPIALDGGDAAVSPDGADAGTGDASDAPPGLKLVSRVTATTLLPGIPVAAAYNAGTKKVYFACRTPAGGSAGIAVVDDVTTAVVGAITPPAPVASLAANPTTKIVYAAETSQVDVIDSATDTITAMVKMPDGSFPIAGLGVDEMHNQAYVLAAVPFMAQLFALGGATNMVTTLRPPLLTPAGLPPIAVDAVMQELFVLGVDSNSQGEIVTLDGPSGVPTKLASTDSRVDAEVSGIVPLGNGTAAVLLVKPGIVKGLQQKEVALPATFAPAGIAPCDFGNGPIAVVVGLGAGGGLEGYGVDTATGAEAPFAVPLTAGLPAGTIAARLVAAAPIPGGCEIYVNPTPEPMSGAYSPTETIKLAVTLAPP